ncbi:hypothetical protein ACIBAG_11420 [Streptomyces sp. NPDC051243]|uniref:hypothetical protein n=1 Tax=Streptomyces sp. NPDC051243 TaxID=3365646 RepID=UPI0037B63876
MIENDAQLSAADPTWRTAPLAATLLGLPLLVWEYFMYGDDSYVSAPEVLLYGGLVLLAIAWVLPRRRSARMLRVTAAVAGFVCAILPVLFLVWLAMIWPSG